MQLIEVTDDEYKQLMEISGALNTQDNQATADPVWLLYDISKIEGIREEILRGVFLTEKACMQWATQNKYHFRGRAIIHVDSLWRNDEMQLLRNILLTLQTRIKTGVKNNLKEVK